MDPARILLGLLIGSACGAVPLAVSALRHRLGLGVLLFVICALAGASWGGGIAVLLAGLSAVVVAMTRTAAG